MPVKCLTSQQKDLIALWYKGNIKSQKDLAEHFNTSRRTINRVLEERGLATPVARIKGEAYQVMQYLQTLGITKAEELKHYIFVLTKLQLTPESSKLIALANEAGLTADSLAKLLKTPQLTLSNIQGFLNQLPVEQLAQMFYASGLVKVAEIAQQKQKQAAAMKDQQYEHHPV